VRSVSTDQRQDNALILYLLPTTGVDFREVVSEALPGLNLCSTLGTPIPVFLLRKRFIVSGGMMDSHRSPVLEVTPSTRRTVSPLCEGFERPLVHRSPPSATAVLFCEYVTVSTTRS